MLTSCSTKSSESEMTRKERVRLKRYQIEGKIIYKAQCANCHQHDGSGLARLIPPLKDSDYLKADVARTICLIKNGMTGDITVNGIVFNQDMPAHTNLTDIEIAEVATYIYTHWGEKSAVISVKEVRKALDSCSSKIQ